MRKKDLKTGMRVKFENGDLSLVLKDCYTDNYGHQELFFANFNGGFMLGESYDDDLYAIRGNSEYNIVEIYSSAHGCAGCSGDVLNKDSVVSIWEREDQIVSCGDCIIEDGNPYLVMQIAPNDYRIFSLKDCNKKNDNIGNTYGLSRKKILTYFSKGAKYMPRGKYHAEVIS